MADQKHYDGEAPDQPLDPEHFTEAQRKEARELGDGSPAVEPRQGPDQPAKKEPDRK